MEEQFFVNSTVCALGSQCDHTKKMLILGLSRILSYTTTGGNNELFLLLLCAVGGDGSRPSTRVATLTQ